MKLRKGMIQAVLALQAAALYAQSPALTGPNGASWNQLIRQAQQSGRALDNQAPPAIGQTTIVNLDQADTIDAPLPAAPLLAGYGITVNDVTPETQLMIVRNGNTYGGQVLILSADPSESMNKNVLYQSPSPQCNIPMGFTLTFNTPVQSFSFTRPALNSAPSGITFPKWSATALDASGNPISMVEEIGGAVVQDPSTGALFGNSLAGFVRGAINSPVQISDANGNLVLQGVGAYTMSALVSEVGGDPSVNSWSGADVLRQYTGVLGALRFSMSSPGHRIAAVRFNADNESIAAFCGAVTFQIQMQQ